MRLSIGFRHLHDWCATGSYQGLCDAKACARKLNCEGFRQVNLQLRVKVCILELVCDRAHEKYTSGWNLTKHEVSTTKAGQIQILMLIPILILVQVPHTLTSIFIGCRLLDCRLFYIHSQLGANTITMLHADNDIYMADDLYSRTEFAASAEEVFVCGFSPIRHEPASPSCTRSGVRADSGSDADDFASYLQAAASPVPRATSTPQCCAVSPASPFTSAAQALSPPLVGAAHLCIRKLDCNQSQSPNDRPTRKTNCKDEKA